MTRFVMEFAITTLLNDKLLFFKCALTLMTSQVNELGGPVIPGSVLYAAEFCEE